MAPLQRPAPSHLPSDSVEKKCSGSVGVRWLTGCLTLLVVACGDEPGVWKNICPTAVTFGGATNTFTQGIAIDPCDSATLYLGVDSFDPDVNKAVSLEPWLKFAGRCNGTAAPRVVAPVASR